MSSTDPPGPVGSEAWRARVQEVQGEVLPGGSVVVSAPAPFGGGGLGRHMQEIVEALERTGASPDYLSEASPEALNPSREVRRRQIGPLTPLTRFSPAWRLWAASVGFDAQAARALPRADHLIGFNGTSLSQFRVAGRRGIASRSLVAANPHMRSVVAQQKRARRDYPIERPMSSRVLRRNLREYRAADRIYVSSRYSWESFLREGVDEDLLSLFPLTPHPRFQPPPTPPAASTFDVVYVGSLLIDKGVPLLLAAFERVRSPELRLLLVGGWKTRGMRRHIQGVCARDPRVRVVPGDPLPLLQQASLCVHPAYQDGFAYAPAEAMACGVPALVSEDTGMKELITPGVDGMVLPTGDVGALTEAIDAACRGEDPLP